jgi:hypothetical protein
MSAKARVPAGVHLPEPPEPMSSTPSATIKSRGPGPHLARSGRIYLFQIRPPKVLGGGRGSRPLRLSLGAIPHNEARALADTLAALARCLFDSWAKTATMTNDEDDDYMTPDALALKILGSMRAECQPDLQDLHEYDVDPVDAETSPLWLEDLPVRLMEMPRYLLLTQSLDFIPHRCRLGFDAVLQMQPPTPAHWRAALKVCLRLTATNAEIDHISRLPIDLVALATGRRKSVTEIIDEVEAAIAEDAAATPATEPKASSRQPRSMTLQELSGYGPAKSWGLDLATDLAAWKAGELAWADVDRGVLLCGPPGTGKTTFAAALAKSCDAHLVAASVARWQATGHLGDLLKAMRKAFSEARKNAPNILFIDEFDSIGDRAKFSDHHASYSI